MKEELTFLSKIMICRIKELKLSSERTTDGDDAMRCSDISLSLRLSAVWVTGIRCIFFLLTCL